QCAATSKDFVYWEDMNSWENPRTLWPSQLFDIRGVFDGSIMKNGYNGFPTTIYTGTFPSPLGSGTNEGVGAETQNMAYTEDDGASWIKLPFGTQDNPIIWQWPMNSLTGFRDPYIFTSPTLSNLSGNSSGATGDHFLTISSGIHGVGPRLLLYRQTSNDDVRAWTYLGPVISVSGPASFSSEGWSGNFGINFETASVTRLNEEGESLDPEDSSAVDFIGFGTEGGRDGYEGHWPLWSMVTYSASTNGSIQASINAVGVVDWGRAYATVPFPVEGNRSVLVGWTYEDDESLSLAAQRSYQGAFTLFRDLFLKVIRNVDPNAPGLHSAGNWVTRNEKDGSVSVLTLGQRIVREVTDEYRAKSVVSSPAPITFDGSEGYVPFSTQPTGRFYAIQSTLTWTGSTAAGDMPIAGLRVLTSDSEWTNIQFQPGNETLTVDRSHSSLISSYGNNADVAKLRLWPILNGNTSTIQSLNLTVIVDNSALEIYANDVAVITSRVYPWLSASLGAGFFVLPPSNGVGSGSVKYENVELWDGLVNAWPTKSYHTMSPNSQSSALPATTLVVLVLATWFLIQFRKARLNKKPLPPGPKGHWLFGPAIPKEHPWLKFEEWIQEYGPVVSFRKGRQLTVIVGRYDAAVQILEKEGAATADRPNHIAAGETLSGGMRTLLIPNGERLRRFRKALHSQLRPNVAVEYQPLQQINAQHHMLDLLKDPSNHMAHSQGYAASLILSLTYGIAVHTASNDPIVREVNDSQTNLGAALVPGAWMVDSFPILRLIPNYLLELRRQHQLELNLFKSQLEHVREQMISNKHVKACFGRMLIERQEEYKLTDDEAAYLAGSMFGAGAGTSASAISIMVMAAAAFPEAQKKVQEQLDSVVGPNKLPTFQDESVLMQVTAFYLETFRWQADSAAWFAHQATRDIVYDGYIIPAGAAIYGNHWSIARDPAIFPDPERFDPQRWLTADGTKIREDLKVFQFGFGRRVCPGSHVATKSLFINTALMLWSYRILPDQKNPLDTMAFTNTANTHPLPFSVRFEPRRDAKELEKLLQDM
ncbi:cytochrome P450, partial [Favolaschia claudopus]